MKASTEQSWLCCRPDSNTQSLERRGCSRSPPVPPAFLAFSTKERSDRLQRRVSPQTVMQVCRETRHHDVGAKVIRWRSAPRPPVSLTPPKSPPVPPRLPARRRCAARGCAPAPGGGRAAPRPPRARGTAPSPPQAPARPPSPARRAPAARGRAALGRAVAAAPRQGRAGAGRWGWLGGGRMRRPLRAAWMLDPVRDRRPRSPKGLVGRPPAGSTGWPGRLMGRPTRPLRELLRSHQRVPNSCVWYRT